jgi:hypothetical protein
VWSHTLVNRFDVSAIREADVDVGVFEPETGVDIRGDFVVSLDDVLEIDVDKVIEGVYVLLDKAFHFEKGGQ